MDNTHKEVRSLTRGLSILVMLNRFGSSTPTEIATRTKLNRTTVYRLLDTLIRLGFVSRNMSDERFELIRSELIARDEEERNFEVLFSLSRDIARRPQDAGRRIDRPLLTQALERIGGEPKLTFVCGSNPFVEGVTLLLLDLHLPPETIRTERFGG